MKVAVIFYSRGGTTKKMAEIITQELRTQNVETDIFDVAKIRAEQLKDYQGIIIGSPTYYGTLAAEIKKLFDDSVAFHRKLDGKFGAAFTSANNVGGGNETTILSILQAMLIHGMIIQGDPQGDHYGPVAAGGIDKRCEDNCRRMAQRFAKLCR